MADEYADSVASGHKGLSESQPSVGVSLVTSIAGDATTKEALRQFSGKTKGMSAGE